MSPQADRNRQEPLRQSSTANTHEDLEATSHVEASVLQIGESKPRVSSTRPEPAPNRVATAGVTESVDCVKPVQSRVEEEPYFGLRTGDRLFVAVLIGLALLLMLAHWIRLSDWGAQPVEIERHASYAYEYKLDINQATWVEWANLSGLGETLARRIVSERRQNGAYGSIDELQRVKGIGPKTVERISAWLQPPESHQR